MSGAKHATKRAMTLRKTPQKRTSAPVIDLGVLNERLGYFIRRAQLWAFQDFIRRLSSLDISPAEFSGPGGHQRQYGAVPGGAGDNFGH